MEIFPERLKSLRENRKDVDKKWTQKYVANKIGVARETYTGYERGTKSPPMETANRLADLFDVTTDYLTGRSDDPNPQTESDNPNRAFHNFEDITEQEKEYLEEQLRIFRKLKKDK
ncbi:helix-turn-helix transcriptional regulator [Gracilibacillus sp. YIM 98692]|uniref:helix-turn-helix domain-containing protein n=1 Tax=Gracilibacillus sp. YIM 98692 TaxID=2663532 RepID=UPI0013D81A34|nr:helix-turn-helix transcriptional regulator [Gracilibacillus sp. YIM 98692]